MIAALLGAASSLSGAFGAKHDYRPARAAEALQIARDGGPHALTAARLIFKQRTASGTSDGRSAYAGAWATLSQIAPELTAMAQAAGGVDDPPASDPTFPAPGTYAGVVAGVDTRSGIQRELDGLGGAIGDDVATSASRILAGASNAVSGGLGSNRVTIPTTRNTLALAIGAVVLVVILAFVFGRR